MFGKFVCNVVIEVNMVKVCVVIRVIVVDLFDFIVVICWDVFLEFILFGRSYCCYFVVWCECKVWCEDCCYWYE